MADFKISRVIIFFTHTFINSFLNKILIYHIFVPFLFKIVIKNIKLYLDWKNLTKLKYFFLFIKKFKVSCHLYLILLILEVNLLEHFLYVQLFVIFITSSHCFVTRLFLWNLNRRIMICRLLRIFILGMRYLLAILGIMELLWAFGSLNRSFYRIRPPFFIFQFNYFI